MDDELKKYRLQLVDTMQKVSESYDKTIITLSGGALALSFTFIKNFIDEKQIFNPELLFFSWVLLASSLSTVLLSLFFARLAFKKAIEQVDNGTIYNTKAEGTYGRITSILHSSGAVLLIAGLFLLGGFVYANLGDSKNENREKNTSTSATATTTRAEQGNSIV